MGDQAVSCFSTAVVQRLIMFIYIYIFYLSFILFTRTLQCNSSV